MAFETAMATRLSSKERYAHPVSDQLELRVGGSYLRLFLKTFNAFLKISMPRPSSFDSHTG